MKSPLLIVALISSVVISLSAYGESGGPISPVSSNTYIYFDLNGGWAMRHMGNDNSAYNPIGVFSQTIVHNGESPDLSIGYCCNVTNTFTAGADIGYQFIPHLGLEGGFYWLKDAKYNWSQGGTGTYSGDYSATVQNWLAYIASRLSVPLFKSLSVYTKAGVSYQQQSVDMSYPSTVSDDMNMGKKEAWSPMFAFGLRYVINHNFIMGIQYLHFVGTNKTDATDMQSWGFSNKDLITANLGYQFNI